MLRARRLTVISLEHWHSQLSSNFAENIQPADILFPAVRHVPLRNRIVCFQSIPFSNQIVISLFPHYFPPAFNSWRRCRGC